MIAGKENSIGVALVVAWICLVFVGLTLLFWAAATPEYTDLERARALLSSEGPKDMRDYRSHTDQWHRDMAALRTSKWQLHDAGCGLITLCICFLAAMAWFRLWNIRNVSKIRSPRSTLLFLLIGSLAWLAYAPVEAFALYEDMNRGYFPYWADSIGIPVVDTAISVLVLLPFLIVGGWVVFLRRARLPANLWIWDAQRQWRSVIWSSVCGILAVLFAVMIVMTVIAGPYLYIPLLLVGFYLILSARAAVISRQS